MTRPVDADRGGDQAGMILINVLVIVMLATAVLALMIAGDDSDIERSIRLREASDAMAVARGAELSAIAALRRDMAEGANMDAPSEKWGSIADSNAAIEGGRFSYAVQDAQARFNVTNLIRMDARNLALFTAIASAAGWTEEDVGALQQAVLASGDVPDIDDLRAIGIAEEKLVALAQLVTFLPEPTDINANTASEGLLAIVLNDPALAGRLVAERERSGGLTRGDLAELGIALPPGVSVSSNYFWSGAGVRIGSTVQRLTSLLQRRIRDGEPEVVALQRWRGATPLQAPAFPLVTP